MPIIESSRARSDKALIPGLNGANKSCRFRPAPRALTPLTGLPRRIELHQSTLYGSCSLESDNSTLGRRRCSLRNTCPLPHPRILPRSVISIQKNITLETILKRIRLLIGSPLASPESSGCDDADSLGDFEGRDEAKSKICGIYAAVLAAVAIGSVADRPTPAPLVPERGASTGR